MIIKSTQALTDRAPVAIIKNDNNTLYLYKEED